MFNRGFLGTIPWFYGIWSLIFLIGGITIGIICFLIGMLINYFIATFANISINLHEINQKLWNKKTKWKSDNTPSPNFCVV